ncbi:MAG TPA: response regulator transcription factor, partial [Bacteroidales bacterium]
MDIKLILADDNIPFRSALKKFLQHQLECEIIAEASNGNELINLPCLFKADIVILDLMMPEMDGINAAREINRKFPQIKTLAVTMHYEKAYLTDLIGNGFKGCVFKNCIYDKIFEAIVTVKNNGLYFPR